MKGGVLIRLLRVLGITKNYSFLITAAIEVVLVSLVVGYIAKKNGKDFDEYFKNAAVVMIVIEIIWWLIAP